VRVVTVLDENEPLLRALASAGCPVHKADEQGLPPSSSEAPYFYLGNMFEQIKRPLHFARIRRQLAAHRAPYVWWNRDAPWNCAIKPWRKLFVRASRRADVHLAHSLQSVELFGEPVVYFPNAAQVERYNLAGRSLESLRDPAQYRYDVSFVGTLNPNFSQVRRRVAFLAALAPRLEREGIGCRLVDTSVGSRASAAEQVRIIQATRINLSIGAVCDDAVPSWGLPERCFGVAACGGFLLCDERRHGPETFPAHAWEAFSGVEECVARIKFFLGHFSVARDKAEALHHDVMEHHTYEARARELLKLVAAWQAAP
jgi:spore maturation protein CgeB